MNKWKLFIDVVAVSALVLNVFLLYHVGTNIKTEGVACFNNPFVYGAEKLSEANDADFIGSGYFIGENKKGITFHFDRNNWSVEFQNQQPQNVIRDWQEVFGNLNITPSSKVS